jgi:hypothetical protein
MSIIQMFDLDCLIDFIVKEVDKVSKEKGT